MDEPKKTEMYGETGYCHDKSGKAHGADEHAVSRLVAPAWRRLGPMRGVTAVSSSGT